MAKRILVIDDEELIIKTLINLLELNRYEVLVAKNGRDGIAIIEEEDFDLIITDIRMPGMNGVETARSIYNLLEEQGRKRIPVIFLTGYADKDIEEKARALSPAAFIYKPFDMPVLLGKIKQVLKL